MIQRVFYASAGRADIIASHEAWRRGEQNPSEVSITFSSQIEDFCRDLKAAAFMVSTNPDGRVVDDGPFHLEHRAKRPRGGLRFHLEEFRYAWSLALDAKRFGADVALIDSGVTHYFMMALFPLMGIPVVPILHNCLWPAGFRPRGRVQRVIQWLDGRFFARKAYCTIAVSPEGVRQVQELTGPTHQPIHEIRAQFIRDSFRDIPPPKIDATPFRVMFIGRVVERKGVLDLVTMARQIEDKAPGLVKWTICGKGDALDTLRQRIVEQNLSDVVLARGWTSNEDLKQVYAESHVSIVPTRSSFAEGLAMTAAEAILAGRPIVSNPIVPALELLKPAAMSAVSNDASSHAEAVYQLATDRRLYAKLQAACAGLREQFYDRENGLTAVLKRALSDL